MKKTFLLLLTIVLISCNTKSQKITENGTYENGVYTCSKFDWKINVPKEYPIRTIEQEDKLEEVGFEAIKKESIDGIQIKKNPPHLIAFGIDDLNNFSSTFESLKGTKRMSIDEHQRFIAELMSKTYTNIKEIEFEKELSTEKIGKYDFYKIKFKLYNEKTESLFLTQVMYNTYISDNLFSAVINYTNEKVNKDLTDNFKNSLTE
jgi:hypothetical protein